MKLTLIFALSDGGAFITLEAGDIFMGLTMSRMHAKYGNCDILSE